MFHTRHKGKREGNGGIPLRLWSVSFVGLGYRKIFEMGVFLIWLTLKICRIVGGCDRDRVAFSRWP